MLSMYLLDQVRNNPEGNGCLTLNGQHLEKWALKTAINLAYLGAFGNGGRVPTAEHLGILFRGRSVPDGMGLYLVSGTLDSRFARAGLHWVDIRDTGNRQLVAVKFDLNGAQFLVCLVAERADKKTFSDGVHSNVDIAYRPGQITMKGQVNAGDKVINLVW